MTDVAGAAVAAPLLPDPSERLATAFRAVARRMEDLPFYNAALEVEAVGFAPWESHWLGVIVTPWSVNLMLAPRDVAMWTSIPHGKKQRYRFPAGEYDFISAVDPAFGEYQMCSLISPALEIPDHATAREIALLARAALLDAANAPVPDVPVAQEQDPAPGPIAQLKEQANAPMSKRDFLRGRFLRSEPTE